MRDSLITIAYIAASALFIMSLGGLSRQETARRGNLYGILGMLIALVATAARMTFDSYTVLAAVLIPGAAIGALLASRVQMTAMPQLVAILHSFVGAAAVLVGFATYTGAHEIAAGRKADSSGGNFYRRVHRRDHVYGFGHRVRQTARHAFGQTAFASRSAYFKSADAHCDNRARRLVLHSARNAKDKCALVIAIALTGILGIHFVLAIGGADMPVVVSMLNSYSGWAAAAAGFMLGNDLLIITGALVGSSGAILSYVMCRGMNRSFFNVMLGGFGTESGRSFIDIGSGEQGEVRPDHRRTNRRTARPFKLSHHRSRLRSGGRAGTAFARRSRENFARKKC